MISKNRNIQEFLEKFYLDNDIRQIVRVLDRILDRKKSILIIGCLEEPLANVLAELGHNVTGVDLREYNKGDVYLGPDTPLYKHLTGDFLDIQFEEKFDLIISVSVIEHSGLGYYKDKLDEDADIKIGRKAYDLLEKQGSFLITVPIGGQDYKTSHWRLYTLESINRIIGKFKVVLQEYWATSYLGNYKATEENVRQNLDNADISILLEMKKKTMGRPKKERGEDLG